MQFELTVLTTISRGITVEAEDYEAAIAEARRMYEADEIDEMHGWVTVTVEDSRRETWHELDQYGRI